MPRSRRMRSGGDYSHPILREIEARITRGESISQIAQEMGRSPHLVKRYCLNFGLITEGAAPPPIVPIRILSSATTKLASRRRKRKQKFSPAERRNSYSARNRLRWQRDRPRMTEVATRNARKGTAVLTGRRYSPERSRRASIGQRGKIMGGHGAKGPAHYFAKSFALRAPDTAVYRGDNILDFVRAHPDLFPEKDLRPRAGTCNAAKQLCKLRPGASGQKSQWKGWTWYDRHR